MKNPIFKQSVTLCLLLITCQFIMSQEPSGSRMLFNDGWKFSVFSHSADEKEAVNRESAGLHLAAVNDKGWRNVELPHDWAIEGPFSDSLENNTGLLPWKGIGWYRKHFTVEEKSAGLKYYIDFEGAMANARVWLNGKEIGGWPYGYTSFRLDLTDAIIFGKENVMAVRLDTKNWDSRWYPGAGLYRNVWLVKATNLHFAYNGVSITTPVITRDKASISLSAEVINHYAHSNNVTVRARVFKVESNGDLSEAPVAESENVTAGLPASGSHTFRLDINVNQPDLWSIEDPQLYRVIVTANLGRAIYDAQQVTFGFRSLEFTPRDGFYLNGKRVEIKGVCNHHDLGALGAAFNVRAAERQLEILKEMGCNAIRTSHNPPAPELLDLCDRMGFLVQVEAFDAWRRGKKPKDYNTLFNAWHAEDLRAMVRRDRNHPSVFMWSIGNEVPDQGNIAMAENLKRIVRSEDDTRPVTAGCDNPSSTTNGFQLALDVFGINYRLGEFEKFFSHKPNDNLPFHSSESASTVSSRGEYFFPVVQGDLNNNLPGKGICQISSYDLAYPWWASTPDQQWEMMEKFPGVFGEFVWTGFDYLGEPTPFFNDITDLNKTGDEARKSEIRKWLDKVGIDEIPSRSSYFGIMDLAGFKKDRFWLYQSKWRPEHPVAHILPHWNWPDRKGLVTPVHVYTSGDEAELFLNGKSLGRRKKGLHEFRIRWDEVVYQPGELKVIAYRNGEKWAEDIMKTTGKASKLGLTADRKYIRNDGYDLAYVTVRIEDSNGLTVPGSNNLVSFSIEGPGKIVAVDNGDATSHEPFQASYRKAFNGLCLVIIKSEKGAKGNIVLKAASKGLKENTVTIETAG